MVVWPLSTTILYAVASTYIPTENKTNATATGMRRSNLLSMVVPYGF